MACQQLISHLSASGRYLQNLAAEHRGTALTGQIAAVKGYIARIAGPAEALQASEAIETNFGPYLTNSQLSELQGLLNDAACKPLEVPAGKGSGKKAAAVETQYWQDTFWRDVPQDVMTDIGDKDVPATARIQKVFAHLADRGLRIPSEKTFVAMLTLFFYVDGCPSGISSATLLGAVQQIKDSWKIYIEGYKESFPDAQASLSWPGNPPGVLCVRLDFIRFTNIFTAIPCRNSHGSLQNPRAATPLSPFSLKSGNGSGSMRRALTLEDTAEANAGGPLAIDYQGHRSIDAVALVGGGEDLVVRAPAAEQALPGPTAQLALPAPEAGIKTAPARVSLAAVTAQLRADAERRETEKKAKTKNKKAKNKKAAGKKKTAGKNAGKKKEADDSGAGDEDTPPAKGRKAKRRKLETEKAKEAAEAAKHNSKMHILASKTVTLPLSTGCESLKKEGAGKKTTAGKNAGQQKEAAGKKISAGKIRAAMEDARKMGKIVKKRRILQESARSIFKQPAARSKPETPAAKSKPKSKPAANRPPADVCFVMRNGTPQERAALYAAYGCPKCRYKPGCTNSCWTARNMQKPREGSLLFVSRSGFQGKWGRTVNFS